MTRRLVAHAWVVATAATVGSATLASAQSSPAAQSAGRDSVHFGELLTAAERSDPRQRQLELQNAASRLRLRGIAAERLPTLGVNGQSQYHSAVTKISVPLPGVTIPTPSHDTYDAHLVVTEPLYDPTRATRADVERARLAESRAQIRGTLFTLRQEVTDAFFAAASLQQRIAELDAAIADVAVRQRETVIRFREGTALRGDTAALTAALIERRQDRIALAADRGAALARLALLTGRSMQDSVLLVAPSVAPTVAHVLATLGVDALDTLDTLGALRARPEYEQFAAARERLAQQSRLVATQEKPRVSAYGRVGYGRPGLNMLSTQFQQYWVAGLQLQWTPYRWGAGARDRELLELERDIVATNEAAFTRALVRSAQPLIATIARLDSTIVLDERVIALREQVAREAQVQLAEGAVTAAAYADRSTELLTARLRRVQHRVALDQARVSLLNTLGVEVR